MKQFTSFQEAMSVAMLDITSNVTTSWLSRRLSKLIDSVSTDKEKREDNTSPLPTVAFFADSGNFENLPAYFQVFFKVLPYMHWYLFSQQCIAMKRQ